MSESTNAKRFCNPIVFTNGEVTWAYPTPHLLAMHLKEANAATKALDIIEFYFSTDRIQVEGRELSRLWAELRLDKTKPIRPTAAAAAGDYQVQKLMRWKDSQGDPEIIS